LSHFSNTLNTYSDILLYKLKLLCFTVLQSAVNSTFLTFLILNTILHVVVMNCVVIRFGISHHFFFKLELEAAAYVRCVGCSQLTVSFTIFFIVMAYMEMFGNCSHTNDSDFMRHSVHMVQSQWGNPSMTTLATAQSCSFSHASIHSSSKSIQAQSLCLPSHSSLDR